MLQVQVIQNDGLVDITAYTGQFSISDNIQSLGREFNFTFNNNKYRDTASLWIDLQMGNTIVVYDNGELIYQGTIVSGSQKDMENYDYKCYDNAYYLNKNQSVIQFSDITVKQAIERLCTKENIPCKIDCDINTKVTKIYNGEVISKIIDDLLKLDADATNIKYRREYNYGSLYINSFQNLKMIYDKEPIIGNFQIDKSIENLANKVIVVSSSEKNTTVQATAQDESSINIYGRWTHYEKVEDKKIAQVQSIANNKLKELNKTTTTIKLTLWGDNYVRSGRILQFNQDILKGDYLVTNCTHTYTGDVHTMEVDLENGEELGV